MRDIFISYVHEDREIAEELAAKLEEAGYTTWYYTHDNPSGDYVEEITEAIEQCQAFALIISPNSVNKPKQVYPELAMAHETGKKFIPLRSNISHPEFKELQPKWAFLLATTITIEVPPNGVGAVVPSIVKDLREAGKLPSPDATGRLKTPATLAEPLRSPTRPEPKTAAAKPAARQRYFIAAASVVLILAGAVLAYIFYPKSPEAKAPLLETEFKDLFVDLKNWVPQPPDWLIKDSYLQLKNQNLIHVRDLSAGDFTMKFHLKLINAGGAAWALRVKDQNNYYLFYLTGQDARTGPDGQAVKPGYFYFYVIRDGKPLQCNYESAVTLKLTPGSEHDVYIEIKGDEIAHNIQPQDDPSENDFGHKLGRFSQKDCRAENNLLPRGSIGFRTVSSEEFSVAQLYVWPPGMEPVKLLE